jgi:hypothetical protein
MSLTVKVLSSTLALIAMVAAMFRGHLDRLPQPTP